MTSQTNNNVITAAQTIKNALGELRTKQAVLIAEETALRQRQTKLNELPIPPEDVKQVIFAYIDACSKEFLNDGDWIENIKLFLYPDRKSDYNPKKRLPLNYAEARLIMDGSISPETTHLLGEYPKLLIPNANKFDYTNMAAMFFFGDIIKAKIVEQFDAIGLQHLSKDRPNVGPSIAERDKEMALIDARLKAIKLDKEVIEKQLADLYSAATI